MRIHLRSIGLLLLALIFVMPTVDAPAGGFGTMPGTTLEELFPWATFDPAIPSPEAVTGVEPGSRPLRHAEVVRYLEKLADASPRATLTTYSETHEGRALVILAVSDEDTVANLEDFRAAHVRRMDPRGRKSTSDGDALIGAKAVAWMAYAIHGDELSSTDAAVALAYWLTAGEDDRAKELRDGLLVLIDPLENPDGRERFLAQTESFAHRVPNPDQEDLSHTAVWPWGRGNHYLFDLNRDWFSMVQPESRHAEILATFSPQLVLDCHEMGSNQSYLFSPPRAPHNPFLPVYESTWWERFAQDQARALDERGYGYFTGEWNEEFFPGYGNSWPAFHGAIGILYEMSGTEGTLVRRHDGTVRTFSEAVEHQVVSSVASLESLATNRQALLADFVAARRSAVESPRGPARAWLLPPGEDASRTDKLARLLRRQGLEVYRADAAVQIGGLRNTRTGEGIARELPEGTWMVPLDQPASPLASVLLDPHVPIDDSYLREERESIELGKGSRLYDTTAWSLPLLFGVEAYWTAKRPDGPWSLDGDSPVRKGSVEIGEGIYAYLLEGTSDATMGALAQILQKDIKVQVAEKPFAIAGHSYSPGSLLVRKEGNPQDLGKLLGPIADHWGAAFRATMTARSEEGPDLGGEHFHPLHLPRIGILAGMPILHSAYGSLWYVLDERVGLRFNGLDLGFFSSFDLERYNVLVFPPIIGGSGAYRRALGEEGLATLRLWVEAGGTAVGIGSGANFLAETETELTTTRLRSQALDLYPPVVLGAPASAAEAAAPMKAMGLGTSEGRKGAASVTLGMTPVLGSGARPFAPGVTPADLSSPTSLEDWHQPTLPTGKDGPDDEDLARADSRLRSFSPRGALLRVDLDPRHWLSWGVGDESSVLLRASDTLVAPAGVDVVARFADPDRLHLGGLLWPEAAGRLAHTAYATREELGSGQVILFLDHPTFRAWPLDTQRMFLNALLLGPGLGTDWSTPW